MNRIEEKLRQINETLANTNDEELKKILIQKRDDILKTFPKY